ncbi:MAG TPA: alpha/beta-hydrolase family protein [Phycicoccus sp.]|nr:alpha/beta-hydrolase family protein [Phycicoccus sp.]
MTRLETPPRPEDEQDQRATAVRAAVEAGQLLRRLEPPLGRPEHVTEPRFSGAGLVTGLFFLTISFLPSLLPRDAYVQGVISGLSLLVGYGVGTAVSALYRYLRFPRVPAVVRAVALSLSVGAVLVLTVLAVWKQVGWQNDLRRQYGMEPIGPGGWPLILAVTLLVAGSFLVLARFVRAAFARLRQVLGRRLSRELSTLLGVVVVVIAVWALYTGVLVNGFFAAANALSAGPDRTINPRFSAPTSPERSGGPGSLVDWRDLGREGRNFVSGGPTVADINAVSGGGAKLPIRVYVGQRSADTLQQRADLVLAELKRTGAFQRKVLVLATTTGTGYLDRNGTDPLEFMWNGDTAIAGVQYSYLPSWISLLADQEAVQATSQAVFDTVQAYWSTLPASQRPRLYLYGLSLGSYGVEQILGSINMINEPISGALLVGPPFFNPVHARLEADRDAGSPAWLPVYGDGRTVRFTAEQNGLERTPGPWGPTRVVYLQHASDPVVFFSRDLAFSPPEWLRDGQRGPDVSPRMGWFPIVTMVQVLLDLPGAGNVPMGYGHLYSATAHLTAWAAITDPPNWSAERAATLSRVLEARPHPYSTTHPLPPGMD